MAVGWLVDLGVFTLLVGAAGIAIAQFAARLAGALSGFVLHRTVTFARSGRYAHPPLHQLLAFALVWAVNYGVTVIAIELIVRGTGWNPVVAKLLVECVVVPSNFLILRHFVFRNE
jgi:putative flippase GtrA